MGVTSSNAITKEDLDEYAELLYLQKSEILHLYNRFKELGPEVSRDRQFGFDCVSIGLSFPELRWNPFFDRIADVFSSKKDGKLSFEDILDLYSAFNVKCPSHVKAIWAFQLFDFHVDGQINKRDIVEIIERLTGAARKSGAVDLTDQDKEAITEKILIDLDLDKTGGITAAEFTHAVLKMPDFSNSFKLKV